MREGTPLPGMTPLDVVSQLTYRVLGPVRRDRVAAVLDFHGLAGRPAQTQSVVAARHGVAPATLRAWVGRVAAAGARLPLPPAVVTAILRRSRPDQDHLGRTRIAATLGLAAPQPPAVQPAAAAGSVGRSSVAAKTARAAIDVVSTVGPLELDDLLAAVTRQRRVRGREPLDGMDFAAALRRAGATVDGNGRWVAPPGRVPPARYRAVAAAAVGRVLSHGEMIAVLIAAGYTPASAEGISARHPLFERVGPNRYRLIGGDRASAPDRAGSDGPGGEGFAGG